MITQNLPSLTKLALIVLADCIRSKLHVAQMKRHKTSLTALINNTSDVCMLHYNCLNCFSETGSQSVQVKPTTGPDNLDIRGSKLPIPRIMLMLLSEQASHEKHENQIYLHRTLITSPLPCLPSFPRRKPHFRPLLLLCLINILSPSPPGEVYLSLVLLLGCFMNIPFLCSTPVSQHLAFLCIKQYKATVIKAVWYWLNKVIKDTSQSPEIGLHKYQSGDLEQRIKGNTMERRQSLLRNGPVTSRVVSG